MHRPTSHDVAERAGVAQSTVSRVFSGKSRGRVSVELESRIRRAAEELGYEPLPSGRALSSGRSYAIGLVVTDFENVFFGPFARGAQRAAAESGYSVSIIEAGEGAQAESAMRLLSLGHVDGLLLFAIAPPALPAAIDRRRITLVESIAPGFSCVAFDSAGGIASAVSRLAGDGHRRIAYLSVNNQRWTFRKRAEAFRQAAADHGLPSDPGLLATADFNLESIVAVASKLLREVRPTAIVCADDMVTAGVYRAAVMERLHIPNHLSVISFGGTVISRVLTPVPTSLTVSAADLGEIAIGLQIANFATERDPQHVYIPTTLRDGESTAPCVGNADARGGAAARRPSDRDPDRHAAAADPRFSRGSSS